MCAAFNPQIEQYFVIAIKPAIAVELSS